MDNTIPVVNDGKTQSQVAAWLHEHNADDLVQAFEQQGYTELADLTPEALDKLVKDKWRLV